MSIVPDCTTAQQTSDINRNPIRPDGFALPSDQRAISDAWSLPTDELEETHRINPDLVPELYRLVGHVPIVNLNICLNVGDPFRGAHLVEAMFLDQLRGTFERAGSPGTDIRDCLAKFADTVSAEDDRSLLATGYANVMRLPIPYCRGLFDGWGDREPCVQFPEPDDVVELSLMRAGHQDGLKAWELCRRLGLIWFRRSHGPRAGEWVRYCGL